MAAVRLVAQQAAGPRATNQIGGRHNVVAVALGDFKGQRKPQRVDDKVDLRRQSAARSADAMDGRPPFPPAAC